MTGVQSYSIVASENVQANTGINWDEGMPPASVNNSARQNMADMRSQWNDASWFQYGIGSKTVAATYSSGTAVVLAGADATAYWHAGRRVKAVGSGTGTIYGTVSSSSFATSTTTINVIWDSGSLSNEALTVYAGTPSLTGRPQAVASCNPTAEYVGERTYNLSRIHKVTGIAQSTTADIFRFLDWNGNLFGNVFVAGFFTINVIDEANGANNSTYVLAFGTTGDGVGDYFSNYVALASGNATVVRGTALVSGFAFVADGGGGAVKLQLTTAASGKTVTVRVGFQGMVK